MAETKLIGRVELVDLPQLSIKRVPSKVDTGADACSIWAHKIERSDDGLNVVFFGPDSPFYNGIIHTFQSDEFEITRISNSFGKKELRYKVKLKVKISGKLINGTFTLSDRSTKLYPILIGRSLLRNKFIVDVSIGKPLLAKEKTRKLALKEELIKSGKDKL